MRTRSSSPPIHVHVNDSTPVHVHVKSHRTSPARSQVRDGFTFTSGTFTIISFSVGSLQIVMPCISTHCLWKGKTKVDKGNLRPTAKVKTRVPWIPPGKSSTRDVMYKWEVISSTSHRGLVQAHYSIKCVPAGFCSNHSTAHNLTNHLSKDMPGTVKVLCHRCRANHSIIFTKGPMHNLEITPPLPEPEPERSHSALRLADLTSEEEEGLHGRISQYERKIESLLTEVSSLKNEVSFFWCQCDHHIGVFHFSGCSGLRMGWNNLSSSIINISSKSALRSLFTHLVHLVHSK